MRPVIIVGGGFTGLRAAKDLGSISSLEITLFDARNQHLLQVISSGENLRRTSIQDSQGIV